MEKLKTTQPVRVEDIFRHHEMELKVSDCQENVHITFSNIMDDSEMLLVIDREQATQINEFLSEIL
jgi:hypothetical protein